MILKLIDSVLGFGLKQEDGSSIAPMALAHPSIPLEAGRKIYAKTCGLDYVFPPDDLGSGLYDHDNVSDDTALLLFPWFQIFISIVYFRILYVKIWI